MVISVHLDIWPAFKARVDREHDANRLSHHPPGQACSSEAETAAPGDAKLAGSVNIC